MKRKIRSILCSCLIAAMILPNQGIRLYAASEEETMQEQSTEDSAETDPSHADGQPEETCFQDVEIDDSLFTFEFVDSDGNAVTKERNIDSLRLIVSGKIKDPEHVIAQYDDLTLLQYTDTETFKKAYTFYKDAADFVDVDAAIVASGDEYDVLNEHYTSSEMDEENNPLMVLEDLISEDMEETPESRLDYSGAVALIDTGVDEKISTVFERVSMLGDDGKDESGHGSRMAELILKENPDVKILSIKALGSDGSGDLSAVIAAIRYAAEKEVSIINLSMSTVRTESSSALEAVIKEAVAKGIKVVVSAGNNNADTRYFTPAFMEDAIVAGSCTAAGEKEIFSNFGESVDVNVVSTSTSDAAAILSGIISRDGKYEIDNIRLFSKGFSPQSSNAEGDAANEDASTVDDNDAADSAADTFVDDGEAVTVENDPQYAPDDPLLMRFQQEVNAQKLYASGIYNAKIISYNASNKQKASTGAIKDDAESQFTKKILKKALATSYQQPDKIKFTGGSGIWKIGYVPANNYYTASTKCKYITCPANTTRSFDDVTIRFSGTNPYAKKSSENYDIYVTVNEIANRSGKTTAFAIDTEKGVIGGAEEIYSDAGLKNKVSDQLYANDAGALYVNMTIKVTYRNSTDPEKEVPRLYSRIEDIDWGQSFYNHTAPFATGSNGNVYIESAALFDQDENGSGLLDYFYDVNGGSAPFTNAAIYSAINAGQPYTEKGYFGSPSTANLYHRDNTLTSARGSVQTWGWHHSAWSAIDVRSETYTIKYSSVNGTVSTKSESVWAETTMAGSANTANSGYHAENKPSKEDPDTVTEWTTDQAMYLSLKKLTIDGVSYPAYSILKAAQVSTLTSGTDYVYFKKDARIQMKTMKKIVVTKDLSFTAHNTQNPKVTYSVEPSGSGTLSRTSESVDYGTNPKGSANTPKEGWSQSKANDLNNGSLTCWTTDQELYIRKKASSGEITGDLLTAEEAAELAATQYLHYEKDSRILMSVIKKIKVTEDLAFTAHNKKAATVRIYKWIDRGDEEALTAQDFNIYVEYTKLVTNAQTGETAPSVKHTTLRLGTSNVAGGSGTRSDPYYWEIPYVSRGTKVSATERNYKIGDDRFYGAVKIGSGSYTVMEKDAAGEYIAKGVLTVGTTDAENAIYFRNRYYPAYILKVQKLFSNDGGLNIRNACSGFNIRVSGTVKIAGETVSSLTLDNATSVSANGRTYTWLVTTTSKTPVITEQGYDVDADSGYECCQQQYSIDGGSYASGTSASIEFEEVSEDPSTVKFRNKYRAKTGEKIELGSGDIVKYSSADNTPVKGAGFMIYKYVRTMGTVDNGYDRDEGWSVPYTWTDSEGNKHSSSYWHSNWVHYPVWEWSGTWSAESSAGTLSAGLTDEHGVASFPTLETSYTPTGTLSSGSVKKEWRYDIKEKAAVTGFKLNTDTYTISGFGANPSGVSIPDDPFEGTVTVYKKDQAGNLVDRDVYGGSLSEGEAAAFQIKEYNSADGGWYAYSYDGDASIKYATSGSVTFYIRYTSQNQGKFRIYETSAPTYYDDPAVDHYDVTLTSDNQKIEKTFNNTQWGRIRLIKDMENGYDRSILDPNNAVSLEGAVYGLYESESDAAAARNKGKTTGKEVVTFTTKGDGKGITQENKEEVWLTTTKTYYVAELIPSPGFLQNTNIGTVTIRPGQLTMAKIGNVEGVVEETPVVADPICIQKVDVENLDIPVVPEGFEAIDGLEVPDDFRRTLKGAQFTVEYYDDLYARVSEVTGSPRRAWVFETDEEGRIDMSDPGRYKVSGDDMYYCDNDGVRKYVLPIGTYVIYESQPPAGFDLNEEKYMIKVNVTNKNEVSRIIADAEGKKLSSDVFTDDGALSILRFAEPVSDVSLTIHKIIRKGDLYPYGGHGVANFAFRIEGYTMIGEKKKWHTVIDFSDDPGIVNTRFKQEDNEEAELSETLTIPAGFYKITELETDRWALVDVSVPEGAQFLAVKQETGTVRNGIPLITGCASGEITDKGTPHEVTFKNRKVEWQEYSHLDQIKNAIRVAETESPEIDISEDDES